MKRILKLVSRIASAFVLLAGIYLVLRLQGGTTAAALVGVLGVGTGFALQGILQNFAAGLYLRSEKPFEEGDQLALGIGAPVAGAFVHSHFRTTELRSASGERILVPHAMLFDSAVVISPPLNKEN